MELKNLISESKETKVYKCDKYAVKVYEEGVPKIEVLNTALVHSLVEGTGLSVPKIREVSRIDGKWAISTKYVEGKNLRQLMEENPDKLEEYINLMVDIQLQIHARRVPTLPKLKYQLRTNIESLEELDDIKKYELLTRLESMPKHIKLCHGNFEPGNIIIGKDDTYIVDWKLATQGNASADVGKTYMMFSLEDPKKAELYLDTFCKKSNTAKRYVQEWLPIIAAARLKENKPEEKDLLMKWLDVVDYD